MKGLYVLVLFVLLVPALSVSQTASDAYRFSISSPSGTARNLGAGNSMFAIGPDFSAIALNPSGIGGYGKSEFLITGSILANNLSAAFQNDPSNETASQSGNFTLPNLGFIIYNRPSGSSWIASNWAIGFNRVADYNRDLEFVGNTLGSITDAWRENATGIDWQDLNGFEEGMAYETGAIYDLDGNNIYESDYQLNDQYALFKHETSFREGGKTELFLGYGANFDHKVMVGLSVGFPILNYHDTRTYREMDEAADAIPFFNELEYTNTLNTTGFGINGKIGVTVKPTRFLNIAFAFHSPTRLLLSDDFNTTLTYDFTTENHDGPLTAQSPFGSFEYALRTPWSVSGGLGIIAGTSGFVALHAKYVDYGSMKYRFDVRGNGNLYDQIEREINSEIKNEFGGALELNAGGELVLDAYRIRGGISFDQSPYLHDDNFSPAFHAGAGYRAESFYIDLGYKLSKSDEGYQPYETLDAPQPLAVIDQTLHQFALTAGFKF